MSSPAQSSSFSGAEKRILAVLAAVQFVSILDFMMVMPMGPDLGRALGISMNELGWIGGSYTFAAFVSGIAGSLYLDRLERRSALIWHLLGLALATAAGALATDFATLVAARVAAGLFGGPATSTLLAILSDVIRPEKRGRALGIVMAAFSVASILGVPVGLELARLGGWKLPFLSVGGAAFVTALASALLLPSVEHHRRAAQAAEAASGDGTEALLSRGAVPISLFLAANAILATFLLVPNLSAFLQFSLGFPRERLGLLYFVGGVLSLISTRFGGIWNDRIGSFKPLATSTTLFIVVLATGMLFDPPLIASLTDGGSTQTAIVAWFGLLMFTNSLRWISISTLTSKVPPARHRARYMSLLSAVQHLSSSLGAFLSTLLLTTGEAGRLVGLPRLAAVSLGISLMIPPLALVVQRLLQKNR
jgi:predicted MFS family arabinose efflux permease